MIRNRIVLLGASNLTLSLRIVINQMQKRLGGSSEVHVAAGHGRSYGQYSQVLFRGLPGIAECGLWSQIESGKTLPTYVLMTDIGNDIAYEYEPEKILYWLSLCIARLQNQAMQIVLTNIPIQSIASLPERRFNLLRGLLYPNCRLSRHELFCRVEVLHQGLIEMAATNQITLCEQEPKWFGLDGIHVRYMKREAFYQSIARNFRIDSDPSIEVVDNIHQSSGWKKRPSFSYQTLCGKERYCSQPSGGLLNGSTVSLY